ncbi:MAG: ABC transporter permease [Pseudomonadota bacterium]
MGEPDIIGMGQRRFGRVNWLGLRTLIARETARFANIWSQTILAPVATAALFLGVFSLALSARAPGQEEEILRFLAPGILMMTVIQNAFANSSSSLLVAKVQGNIVDTLMPPLSALELTIGYALGGVVRGVAVALGILLTVFPFIGLGIAHPVWAATFLFMGSVCMALLGTLGAIVAQKFDHLSAVTNFVITPLSFLSGTFYSISILPEILQRASAANPFFYMIDGIRFGVLGASDADPARGLAVLVVINGALAWLTWRWFRTGYKLKA